MRKPATGEVVSTNIKIERSLWQKAKIAATLDGMMLGEWVAHAIREKLDKGKGVK